MTGVAGELLCRLSQFTVQMSVLVSTGSLLVTALNRFFPCVLSTQENNNNSYRPVSDWRHLDFFDSVHGEVIQNDHLSRIQAGLPCLYLQFWNHWLRCANRLSFSVDFWNDGLFLWLKNCLLLELSVPWLVSGML